jgi:NAD(P)H-quinone oxidoreductase subunit 5
MKTADEWSAVLQGVALLIPGVLALLALVSPRRAALAASAALGLALLFGAGLFASQGSCHGGGGDLGVRLDAVTSVMLLLVSFIGLIIVRYARTYLHGEAGLARFHRWLLLTLAAVTSLVVVNNLLVLALAWIATSVALHQLLTFYPDRTAAVVAAHKKFLVSRLADLCLLGFLALTQASVGSLELDQVTAWAGAHPGRTPSMQLAAGLLVVAVALKSAQLPFHGWLTQVMEAPTPVSALLHAGVVNIGGFVLIRLAPLLAGAGPARMLLVVVGLVSTVIASLIMTTRVSVKVALAWSTCAQLGFMLVQCGLGLWHLALLHLVAHSLYKAHAFLSTGTAVHGWRLQARCPGGGRCLGRVRRGAAAARLGGVRRSLRPGPRTARRPLPDPAALQDVVGPRSGRPRRLACERCGPALRGLARGRGATVPVPRRTREPACVVPGRRRLGWTLRGEGSPAAAPGREPGAGPLPLALRWALPR